MGRCRYCGLDAGLLRSAHAECEQRHKLAKSSLASLVKRCIDDPRMTLHLRDETETIAKRGYIDPSQARNIVLESWCATLDQLLADGILSREEEARLVELARAIGITRAEMESQGALKKIAMGRALRNILVDGRLPEWRPKLPAGVFVNTQRDEEIVWVFENVGYAKETTKRYYTGGGSGFGFRVAKGVYFRIGGGQGYPVTTESIEVVDRGCLILTTKHIYFVGLSKSFKISYSKIVSFQPYADGIGLVRDRANAKLEIFSVPEGWFVSNLAINLSNLAKK
ncbi:MAG: hypothetical protein ACUVRS_00455 [Armatimonadota bacterium]